MLEQRDLEMLKGVMESVVHESGNKIIVEMDTRFRESENMILEELDRVQINLEIKIKQSKIRRNQSKHSQRELEFWKMAKNQHKYWLL